MPIIVSVFGMISRSMKNGDNARALNGATANVK
jgi:hypothetical protein